MIKNKRMKIEKKSTKSKDERIESDIP